MTHIEYNILMIEISIYNYYNNIILNILYFIYLFIYSLLISKTHGDYRRH